MDGLRKQEIAMVQKVKEEFTDIPFLTVYDSWPDEEIKIPSVVVDPQEIQLKEFEMGSRKRLRLRNWNIEIYASNKTQRNEVAYRLLELFEEQKIAVYDYDQGFDNPPRAGTLLVFKIEFTPIAILPELVEKMFYRGVVSISTEFDDYSRR
ncbi:MAG: hypothetical protein GYA36_18375 [Veillonellaceae bacterium]|nr:hypothetical protein [Veillonellaceae bacterium]